MREAIALLGGLVAMFVGLVLCVLIARPAMPTTEQKQEEQKRYVELNQQFVNEVVNRFTYIKDPRTNVCVLNYKGEIVVVPEKDIPPNLLWVADIKELSDK